MWSTMTFPALCPTIFTVLAVLDEWGQVTADRSPALSHTSGRLKYSGK